MADEELRLIPEIPATLREAAQVGTLIPFIGAGVSRLAGCPSWEQLAQVTCPVFFGPPEA